MDQKYQTVESKKSWRSKATVVSRRAKLMTHAADATIAFYRAVHNREISAAQVDGYSTTASQIQVSILAIATKDLTPFGIDKTSYETESELLNAALSYMKRWVTPDITDQGGGWRKQMLIFINDQTDKSILPYVLLDGLVDYVKTQETRALRDEVRDNYLGQRKLLGEKDAAKFGAAVARFTAALATRAQAGRASLKGVFARLTVPGISDGSEPWAGVFTETTEQLVKARTEPQKATADVAVPTANSTTGPSGRGVNDKHSALGTGHSGISAINTATSIREEGAGRVVVVWDSGDAMRSSTHLPDIDRARVLLP